MRTILRVFPAILLAAQLIGNSPVRGDDNADESAQKLVSSFDKEAKRLAKDLGGLSDDEQAKLDALEKKLGAEIKADPDQVEAPDFRLKTFMRIRDVLTPEHQKGFDKAMARSKKIRASITTSAHLRSIGTEMLLYIQQHDGKTPADLGALAESSTSPEDFLAGDSKTQPPADWASMTAKARADWANKNSDFIYLAGGKSADVAMNVVWAYVKPEVSGDDDNAFLLADGSVWAEKADKSQAIISELKDGKNPAPSLKGNQ